jgi:hypothetical protein
VYREPCINLTCMGLARSEWTTSKILLVVLAEPGKGLQVDFPVSHPWHVIGIAMVDASRSRPLTALGPCVLSTV